jgi:hypothetical protein
MPTVTVPQISPQLIAQAAQIPQVQQPDILNALVYKQKMEAQKSQNALAQQKFGLDVLQTKASVLNTQSQMADRERKAKLEAKQMLGNAAYDVAQTFDTVLAQTGSQEAAMQAAQQKDRMYFEQFQRSGLAASAGLPSEYTPIRGIDEVRSVARMFLTPQEQKGLNAAPDTRTMNRGGTEVTQEWRNGQWVDVGSGPRWNPVRSVQGVDPETGLPITQILDTSRGGIGGVDAPTGITVQKSAFKPLPKDAQEGLSQALDAFKALEMMESGISESGRVEGLLSKGQAMVGMNQKAIEFETARANMKLAAQALIKGIPSNFDVETVINTLPDLGLPETVNRSRIDFSRELLENMVRRTVAFYKGTGHKIPGLVLREAHRYGVPLSDVSAWSGTPGDDDPFGDLGQVVETDGKRYVFNGKDWYEVTQ